jgi:hypothetical protein
LQLLATGVVSHREELIKIREGTAQSVRSLVKYSLAAIQTNKQTNKHIAVLKLVPGLLLGDSIIVYVPEKKEEENLKHGLRTVALLLRCNLLAKVRQLATKRQAFKKLDSCREKQVLSTQSLRYPRGAQKHRETCR